LLKTYAKIDKFNNQIDITYIKTNEGWLYLTKLIDLYDSQIVGWSLSKTLFTKETITPAWKMGKVSKKEFLLNGLIISNCETLEDSNKQKIFNYSLKSRD
jgi:putative transposase